MMEMTRALGFQGFGALGLGPLSPKPAAVEGLGFRGFRLKSVVLNPLHLLGEVFEELTKRLF